MAFAIETSLAGFFGDIPLAGFAIDLSESVEVKSTAGGDVLLSQHGSRYWYGQAVLGSNFFPDHESQMARIRALQVPGRTFLLSPRHHDGSDLALSANARISAVTSGRVVTFTGARASQLHRRGTFLSVNYGGADRLYQLAEDATSTSGGGLGPVEITPDLESGYVIGTSVVRFNAPVVRAIIMPNSVRPVMLTGRRGAGIAFDWRQQLIA